MIILTVRTDKPLAEIGLYNEQEQTQYISWEAHRQLAETLHTKLKELLDSQELKWSDIQGIVCYEGPGSFTGLRIGISVANALASSLAITIVATTGDDWIPHGIADLQKGKTKKTIIPEYGQPVQITQPRK